MSDQQRDHQKEMLAKWDAKLTSLFGGDIPAEKVWESPQDILTVLQHIAGPDTHMFLPTNGGDDLVACRLTAQNHLEWTPSESSLDEYAEVVVPLRLTFWKPGSTTHEANFVLETGSMEPVGKPSDINDQGVQEVTEIKPGVFASRSVIDNGEYQGGPVPASARLVVRRTKPGRYAIFSKGSIYNNFRGSGFDAYDAFHNDPVKFAGIVESMAKAEI